MTNPSDFVRSYMLDPFPKCSYKPECFEEGNPDLENFCEGCYREVYMASVQVEVIQLEKLLRDKQRLLLKHQTKIAMKRSRLRHRCLICEESGHGRNFINNIDATEHVLLCHTEAKEPPTQKRRPSTPKKKREPIEEESI